MDYVEVKQWQEDKDAILSSVKEIRDLVEKNGETPETKDKIEQIEKQVAAAEERNEKFTLQYEEEKKQLVEHKEKLEELESKLCRPSAGFEDEHKDLAKRQIKALNDVMRDGGGNQGITDADKDYKKLMSELVEKKYLRTDVNPDGGYLVPPEYVREIIKDVTEISPVRSVARIMQTSRNSVQIPRRQSLVQGGWNGEGLQASQSESTYGNEEIPLNKLSVFSVVTNELLNDSEFNIADEVQMDVTEDFARLEGKGFIDGVAASNQPEGILTNSDIEQVTTLTSGKIDLDTLIKTQGQLKAGYDASWMMNRRTIATIRQIKDGNGMYLWNPDNISGQPMTLFGDTVISAIDVPDISAGSLSVIYGDYARGYLIIDRTTMTMIRDNVTLADKDQTKFTFHRRVAGHVRQAEAMKIVKIKA